jgi:hypothetical protein
LAILANLQTESLARLKQMQCLVAVRKAAAKWLKDVDQHGPAVSPEIGVPNQSSIARGSTSGAARRGADLNRASLTSR